MSVPGQWNYWAVIVLMMVGLYIVIAKPNYVKKLMGLSLFQVSVIMLYVSMGRVLNGTAPIYVLEDGTPQALVTYSNPVPHVLMLTAIVVGIAETGTGGRSAGTITIPVYCIINGGIVAIVTG